MFWQNIRQTQVNMLYYLQVNIQHLRLDLFIVILQNIFVYVVKVRNILFYLLIL